MDRVGLRVVVVVVVLAGCGFEHGHAAPPDGPRADSAVDAMIDSPPDSPPVLGSLTMTMAKVTGDHNLTTEGTADWVQWGHAGKATAERKAGVNAISNLAATPSTTASPTLATESWTDGTPDMNVNNNDVAVVEVQGSSMDFTAPAGIAQHTLRVYVGVQQSSSRISVTLSDASATAMPLTLTDNSSETYACFTITYNAAHDGQTLAVDWTDLADVTGSQHFTMLLAATLQ